MTPSGEGTAASTMGIPFVLSAPSGAGKTTVCGHLRTLLPKLRFSISYTTRPPRPAENHGTDYFFVSREVFEKKIASGEMLEWARVFDHYYGTTRATVDAAIQDGADILIEIDRCAGKNRAAARHRPRGNPRAADVRLRGGQCRCGGGGA